ncbi:transcription antitermination factor NusB [Periweissella ghanensis]|uniref:Transcription antitermination protein NusB n=1 Tax=Periweissella ghanensis TaxID=467997 RepID=A0ABN8BPJ0_9LACO|nr:transcription antitermination factor NusB [Periweissella ghanensis]MCM0600710.1 transcription antitermination factor NusB [Periweissella ghanensis]CAH0418525.1 Transcription antitermination protein NusB [Periweissella ghanensis]
MTISRHQIREKAFQTLFALAGNPEADLDTLYEDVLEDIEPTPAVPDYLKELVTGVLSQREVLEQDITPLLANGWTFDRLARADRIILELAIFEHKYVSAEEAVPSKVVIDEALNLAKTFSDERSRKFINGVLDHAFKQQ